MISFSFSGKAKIRYLFHLDMQNTNECYISLDSWQHFTSLANKLNIFLSMVYKRNSGSQMFSGQSNVWLDL